MTDAIDTVLIAGPLVDVNPLVDCRLLALFSFPFSVLLMLYFESPVWQETYQEVLLLLGMSIWNGLELAGIVYSVQVMTPLKVALLFSPGIVLRVLIQNSGLNGVLPGPGNWVEISGYVIVAIGVMVPLSDYIQRPRAVSLDLL